ncbi:MAG: site-specific DNA-methyltransferase [Planctomycetota bacterium]|nr:site-specific DNA-methyltransferase [Planctomycetota bacterium]
MNKILNTVFNEDCLKGLDRIPNNSVDLVVTDPPYCLGKDYGNNSDKLNPKEYLDWSKKWIDAVIPKIKDAGSLYVFLTWQYSPEIFSYIKTKLIMINEIIWDRRVPSMGGSTRKFSSVHDNIGFFAKTKRYYFNLDSVRIPYDEETKKARTRSIFVGKKWLEVGYNPKDVWSVTRIHAQDPEREAHPTQKPLEIIERIIKASSPKGGIVLDPFMGTGTTAVACYKLNRNYIGFEVNSNYCKITEERLKVLSLNIFEEKEEPVKSVKQEVYAEATLSTNSQPLLIREGTKCDVKSRKYKVGIRHIK